MTTVLVVDDEADIRASVCGILSDEGLRVLEAENGRAALDVIRRERPELVLLDIWMPEADGIQVLRELHREGADCEVVVISGHGNIETAVAATKLGAFDFVEKPLTLEGLLKVVNRALEHRAIRSRERLGAALNGSPRLGAAAGGGLGGSGGTKLPQRTIRRSVVASGHGLHTGVKTGLILQPLPPGSGIQFANLSADHTVRAHVDFVDSTGYATTLHRGGVTARTVEHLLAVFHAYGITNVLVKVQGEVPIMDGSAAEFCRLVESAGIEEQEPPIEEIVVSEPLVVRDERSGEMIRIEPAGCLSIDYTLRYPHPVGVQRFRYEHRGPESFREAIAPARTFGFLRDVKALAAMGLANGGRLDNCILIDEERVVNTALRFPDEFARHKILDIMGDLYLLGRPVRGAVVARMTGHSENIRLVQSIRRALRL